MSHDSAPPISYSTLELQNPNPDLAHHICCICFADWTLPFGPAGAVVLQKQQSNTNHRDSITCMAMYGFTVLITHQNYPCQLTPPLPQVAPLLSHMPLTFIGGNVCYYRIISQCLSAFDWPFACSCGYVAMPMVVGLTISAFLRAQRSEKHLCNIGGKGEGPSVGGKGEGPRDGHAMPLGPT